ncbi:hypothetical protein [Streptomyces sp. NPDC049555]|uniref:hypothetical protein n=1 Tax=unclassified Streptomyces TaxID=2593676 RepID=UPI00341F48C9
MPMWGRAAVLPPVVRAVVAVLTSVLLVLSGSVSAGAEPVPVRAGAPVSALVEDDSSDECVTCTTEQRVPRPGRVGRPAGRHTCPPAFVPAAGAAGGLPGPRAPARPGDAVATGHAHHSVLRC